MKFDDLVKMVNEDMKIDRFKLVEEATRTPNILSKYLEIYRNEKVLLHTLTSKFAILRKQKWEYYSGKASPEEYEEKPFDKKILRQDIDIYLESDEDILTISNKIAMQKEKCFYLEKILRGIEQREFSIKNAITMLKFDSGEIG
jgi:hypothetical protein